MFDISAWKTSIRYENSWRLIFRGFFFQSATFWRFNNEFAREHKLAKEMLTMGEKKIQRSPPPPPPQQPPPKTILQKKKKKKKKNYLLNGEFSTIITDYFDNRFISLSHS